MQFSLDEMLFWAVGVALNLALLFVLLIRGRWREFPTLTVWIAFQLLRAVVLFLIYGHGFAHRYSAWLWYTRIYTFGTWADFALQLAVVFEIARIVLQPTGTWVADARAKFAAAAIAGVAAAGLLAWWVSPPAWSVQYAWVIRGNLFTSLALCELFVVMTMTANRLGLGWRNHVMAVGQGLTLWSVVMVISTALQSWFGTRRYFVGLDHVRELAYFAAAIWMILQLWRHEPERQPISADLQEYILALHRRVEYDLRRLDAPH